MALPEPSSQVPRSVIRTNQAYFRIDTPKNEVMGGFADSNSTATILNFFISDKNHTLVYTDPVSSEDFDLV